jgi:Tfp pilus assembly protein PilO
MSKRQRDALAMALSAMALVALYFSILHPMRKAVAKSGGKAAAVSNRVKEAARKIAGSPEVQKTMDRYRESIEALKGEIGAWRTSRDVAEVLVNEAKRLKLDVAISRDMEVSEGTPANGAGETVSFKVRMPCSYRTFADYVEAIEKAGAGITLQPISLKKENGAANTLMAELIVAAVLSPE